MISQYFRGDIVVSKISAVVFFISVYPAIYAFRRLFRAIGFIPEVTSFFSYACLVVFSLLLLQKKVINTRIGILFCILFLIYLLNLLFADFSSVKWFANSAGFLLIFLSLGSIVASLSSYEIKIVEQKAFGVFLLYLPVLALLALVVVRFDIIMIYNNIGNLNVNIELLRNGLLLEKQAFAFVVSWSLLSYFAIWSSLTFKKKLIFMGSLLILLPFLTDIRTLILGMLLLGYWYLFSKKKKIGYVVIPFIFVLLIYFYWDSLSVIYYLLYDRAHSLNFALSVTQGMPFGIGNGGFHHYVIQNNDSIVSMFGSDVQRLRNLFWIAPESDLVYFIASFGYLSAVIFLLFFFLVFYGSIVFSRPSSSIEKVLVSMAVMTVFMGISQDNSNTLIWWIIISTGAGVVVRRRQFAGGVH